MLAASEPIAGADTPLNIVLGVGVLLLFAGILIRALARQHRALARMSPLRALLRAITRHTASPNRPRPAGAMPETSRCQRATRLDERVQAAALSRPRQRGGPNPSANKPASTWQTPLRRRQHPMRASPSDSALARVA